MSYHTLCLLNDIGKILEDLLVRRFQEYNDNRDGLEPNQYGFRKWVSTDDVVEMLDWKFTEVLAVLSQFMPNIGRSKESMRRLLASVVHSILQYGSLT